VVLEKTPLSKQQQPYIHMKQQMDNIENFVLELGMTSQLALQKVTKLVGESSKEVS
jgi:hypothetical protein